MARDGGEAVVVGAGIGGLAAALALRARGLSVTVLEQAPLLREVGAGLQISPNGLRVLDALGVGDDLRRVGVQGAAVRLADYAAGREVVRLDLTRLPAGQLYHFVHRADLIALLERALEAAGITLRLGTPVQTMSSEGGVVLADGTTQAADLVVAADGLHSVARPVLNRAAAPFFTRQVAWRAVVPNVVGHPPEARVAMGPGRHLVSYPLQGGTRVNLVAVEERAAWTDEGWAHGDDAAAMQSAFAAFGGDVPALLAQVREPGLWGLFRHPVAKRWHGERLALLGDAAHPTLPFLAQGANMALEDAWALAACVARDGVALGLRGYQGARLARVCRVVAAANGNAWKYHLRQPALRRAAHLGMHVLSQVAPGRMLGQFDWLYGYDVTRAVP